MMPIGLHRQAERSDTRGSDRPNKRITQGCHSSVLLTKECLISNIQAIRIHM
eukprot:jgi/Botrbrau1/21976/Bobra.0848s0001.1